VTQTVTIITANSQLGRALVEAFGSREDWRVRALTHAEVDITDEGSVARALDPAPDVVINTAFTFIEEPAAALRVNALGPSLLAGFCAAHNARLVQISTDYVFDGETDRPYRETDCPRPRSVYGISKLAGEDLVRARGPRHLIVRVSSLYGAGGSRAKGGTNFVTDMLAMQRAGKNIRVVVDQIHSPTYAPDAAGTILDLLDRDLTGTFHVSNAGHCSKFDFAAKIFQLAGVEADLVPIRLADLPPGPARPRYSALAHEALRAAGVPEPRPWEEGLAAYLG
jgi:dTDP-4-dehydrorhamnose reductase